MSSGVTVTAVPLAAGWKFTRGCSIARHALRFEVETLPRVHIAALSALMGLIGQASGDGNSAHLVTSNALICGVARISDDPNRRDFHATPQSSSECSKHSETVRSVRRSKHRQRSRGAAGLADTARSDAPYADKTCPAKRYFRNDRQIRFPIAASVLLADSLGRQMVDFLIGALSVGLALGIAALVSLRH